MQSPITRRRGANAIEFAMTLPFFLAIVLGLCDYGYLFMIQAGLDHAVSTACREGATTDPDYANPETVARSTLDSKASPYCDGGSSCTNTVFLRDSGIYAPPNKTLECRSVRTLDPLIGLVPFPGNLESVSYYRLEWQRN